MSEVMKPESMQKMLEDVRVSSEYSKERAEQSTNKSAGLCTLLATQFDRTDNSLAFSSVGDSPLVVIDTNPDGSSSFHIANDEIEGKTIDNINFTDADIAEDMRNPETYLVGIGKDGKVRLRDMPTMRTGKVEYKPGRKVVLASDFLTKMMLLSPQMFDAKVARYTEEGKTLLAEAFGNLSRSVKAKGNKLSQEKFDPSVFADSRISKEALAEMIKAWKENPSNSPGIDDMTAITLDMDKLMANK
jgi:hypothetical protein